MQISVKYKNSKKVEIQGGEYNMKLVEDNLFNLQFVINWQDELNKVSITNVEDC